MSQENPLIPSYNYIQRVSQDIPKFEEVLLKSPGINPFDIEDAFDDEIIDKAELIKYGYFKSIEQKIHSKHQILTIEEIDLGIKLFVYHNKHLEGQISITGSPELTKYGLSISCEGEFGGQKRDKVFFTDLGIIPYNDGLWNAYNWLSRKKI